MVTARILVTGTDSELTDRVSKLIESVPGCHTARLPGPNPAAIPDLMGADTALAIVHHTDSCSDDMLRSFLKEAGSGPNRLPVIVIAEENLAASMLDWLRLGAIDCLSRPLNLERLSLLVDSLTTNARYARDSSPEWLTLDGAPPFCVASKATQLLVDRCRQVGDWDANVLITGETGTGKTHVAKMTHALSKRAREPFVAVNCAAIPESLIESELFGHVRGAFTSASDDREGVFSAVGTGTLFLDEIDTLPVSCQAKLLHAVDERTFSAVGSNRMQSFAGRLLTATNQDLKELTESRCFRRDLYYRLNVLSLQITPLRSRQCEIQTLVEGYIRAAAKRQGCAPKRVTPQALKTLRDYDWPGNIRELQNTLEQALAFCMNNEIQLEDIPISLRLVAGKDSMPNRTEDEQLVSDPSGQRRFADATVPNTGRPLEQARADGEIKELRRALEENGYNRTRTAIQLGISRSALYKRLQKMKRNGILFGQE